MAAVSSYRCPACAAADLQPLADLGLVPVLSGVTFASEQEAVNSAAGHMQLRSCPACGHSSNIAFDPTLVQYDTEYDNSLHHSRVFQGYAQQLAARLAREYDLAGRRVVELGSGKGHFLDDLCRLADATGTGYDPSYAGEVHDPRVEFVQAFLDFDQPADFDFFVARHVVEHIADPLQFLTALLSACGTRPVSGYIEVPDAIYDFDHSPWNCTYQHVSYFSATSLLRLAVRAGFAVRQLMRSFEGQYLGLEVSVNQAIADDAPFDGMGLRREHHVLTTFRDGYPRLVQQWRDRLGRVGYEHSVLWGAGAKGLEFLNAVDPERQLAAVVDLNPAKHKRYLPVTGHLVLQPESLRDRQVSTVIVINRVYEQEIAAQLRALQVDADVIVAH